MSTLELSRRRRLRRGPARALRVRLAPVRDGVPVLPPQVPAADAARAGSSGCRASPSSCRCSTRCTWCERLIDAVVPARLPARAPRDPGPRRLDRRDAAASPARCVERTGASRASTSSTSTARTARASRPARSRTGSTLAKGEFVAVFDADFVPEPDFLQRTVDFFTDDEGRHGAGPLGPPEPRLLACSPQAQAILLDGHFVIEHTARNRSGRVLQLQRHRRASGAATRSRDGGGWQHDTLTEDLDLSYRAQLEGLAVRLPPAGRRAGRAPGGDERLQEPAAPLGEGLDPDRAEAPAAHPAARTCRRQVKREAFFHLTANFAYLLMIPLAILMPLTVVVRVVARLRTRCSSSTCRSSRRRPLQRVRLLRRRASASRARTRWERVKYLPFLMALGIGLSVNNARAVRRGAHRATRRASPARRSTACRRGRVGRAEALQGGGDVPADRRARARRVHDVRRPVS